MKKMRKNSFVEGAVITYLAIIFTKLLGALYNIPFYAIIGEKGGVLYAYAYRIYVFFLDISTSGIPIAISVLVSEYNSKGKALSKDKAYRVGLYFVMAVSLIAFILMQFYAGNLAEFFIKDMSGLVTVGEVATAIRSVSLCLLITPFLSMYRGFLNGHKYLSLSSTSQILEQLVRIVFVLAGSYITIYVFKAGISNGVYVAMLGAFFGAIAAQLYLLYQTKRNKHAFDSAENREKAADATAVILKKIFSYCATIVLLSVTAGIYDMVDLKLLLVGLQKVGYADSDVQLISSITSTWVPKISVLIFALAAGLNSSIAPHLAESYASEQYDAVNRKINQSIMTILAAAIPMACGICLLSEPVYRLFYGNSLYGGGILRVSVFFNIFTSLTTVINMAQQSMGRGGKACLYTLIGLFFNTILDLPFIYLLDRCGLPAYYGIYIASFIGQSVSLVLSLYALKRDLGLDYTLAFKSLLKIIPAVSAMSILVIMIQFIMPLTEGRNLLLLGEMALIALSGAALYLVISYKNGLLTLAFGAESIMKIKAKLRMRH